MAILNIFGGKQEGMDVLPVVPQEIYQSGILGLKDVIAPSAFEVSSSYIRLGEKFARTIFVFAYPRYLATNWFAGVINLDKIFDIAMFFHPVDTGIILRKLRKKVAEVQSQISEREEKGLVRDPMLDTAYRDLENLRDKLSQAQEKLFLFGLYLTVYADTLEDLNREEAEIKS
ncbi:MAG: hypothetical protein EXS68_02115, partial [Candidatus Ryanbacteria bacterium]|nr:hypothetical protein [Candidatus Ryanbacteria bacterium]